MKFDENFEKNVSSYSITALCEIIVCARYFGLDKKIIILCMQELANRREVGEDFDFETYIEDALAILPNIGFTIPDVRQTITQLLLSKIKK